MTAYWPIEQKRPKQVFQRFCRALLEECSFQLETLAADCDAWQSACEIGKNWQPPIKLWSTDMPESILPLSVPASRPRSPTCDKIWYIHDVKQCSPSMSTTVLCYWTCGLVVWSDDAEDYKVLNLNFVVFCTVTANHKFSNTAPSATLMDYTALHRVCTSAV